MGDLKVEMYEVRASEETRTSKALAMVDVKVLGSLKLERWKERRLRECYFYFIHFLAQRLLMALIPQTLGWVR